MEDKNKVEVVNREKLTAVSQTMLETKVTKQDIIDIIYEDTKDAIEVRLKAAQKKHNSLSKKIEEAKSKRFTSARKELKNLKIPLPKGYSIAHVGDVMLEGYGTYRGCYEVRIHIKENNESNPEFEKLKKDCEVAHSELEKASEQYRIASNKGKFKTTVLKKTLEATKEGQAVLDQVNQIKVSLSKDMKLLK